MGRYIVSVVLSFVKTKVFMNCYGWCDYHCLAEGPNQPLSGMWRTLWPVVECSVRRPADREPLGASFVEVIPGW